MCESLSQRLPEPEKYDAEIKLSSKLLLLHKMLQESSKRGLRVVILYQVVRTIMYLNIMISLYLSYYLIDRETLLYSSTRNYVIHVRLHA